MSYNDGGYGRGGGGYGQSNPYGRTDPYAQQGNNYAQQQSNPYSQPQGNPYSSSQRPSNPYSQSQNNSYSQAQSNPYSQPQSQSNPYSQPQSMAYTQQPDPNKYARPNRYGNDVEMGAVSGQNGHQPQSQGAYGEVAPPPSYGPNVLDECRKINDGTQEIDKTLARLENAQRRALGDTVTDRSSPTIREIDTLNAEIMNSYRNLLDKMKRVKAMPGAGSDLNAKHVGLADRKLQGSRQWFMQVESQYQKRMREQTERQYRTAFPDANEQEVRAACEDNNQQVFAQAIMNRDRRGESRQVLGAVRDRHEAIAKIEKQMVELAELFQDMERMVVEQEPRVEAIETGANETHENVVGANEQLVTATKSARAARKKKWICFWIVVVVIIVAIVIVIAILAKNGVFKKNNNNGQKARRSLDVVAAAAPLQPLANVLGRRSLLS